MQRLEACLLFTQCMVGLASELVLRESTLNMTLLISDTITSDKSMMQCCLHSVRTGITCRSHRFVLLSSIWQDSRSINPEETNYLWYLIDCELTYHILEHNVDRLVIYTDTLLAWLDGEVYDIMRLCTDNWLYYVLRSLSESQRCQLCHHTLSPCLISRTDKTISRV